MSGSTALTALMSKETQDVPGSDLSSPPAYTNQPQEPPPYSAAEVTYPPSMVQQDIETSDTSPHLASSSFDDSTVRRGFVGRFVFCIVTLMLLFTFTVVCVFTFSNVVKEAVQQNLWAYLSSYIIFLVVVSAFSCCKSFRRRHPWNIVALVVVNLSLSYMVGTIASFHNTTSVVIATGVTIAISVAIIIFSLQTRFDMTIWSGVLLILVVDLMMFGIFSTFYFSSIIELLCGCLGALLCSLILMIDVQLLTGRMSHRVDPEDYVSGALIVYLDIVLIFLYLLGDQ
ncbi:protein lifeguard 1-like [Genypterus blacodes]|uniref:protein lifeguard 1-like n=1 Tax=Genypterus blacodes TaxID=154954 RepID=UPI003F770366